MIIYLVKMSDTCKKYPVLSAKSFYSGSTKKEYLYQLYKRRLRNERETTYQSRPLPNINHHRQCFSARLFWKWFPRQQQALDYCITQKEKALCLFAFEKDDSKRTFLVSTRKQFWAKYSVMKEKYCHFYEVIRPSDPCRLYFDIEFKKDLNPNLDGHMVLRLFIVLFIYCIKKSFGIECTRKDIVDLDSTTDTKFSRHLIFHFKNGLFVNNIHCGNFVKDVCCSLKSYVENGTPNKYFPVMLQSTSLSEINTSLEDSTEVDFSDLIVQDESCKTFLCDLSVYTKNRNFRLYQSSKVTKLVPLKISTKNEFVFKSKLTSIEKEVYKIRGQVFDAEYEKFLDTLVCHFVENGDSQNMLTFGDEKPSWYKMSKTDENSCPDFVEGFKSTGYPLLDGFVMSHVDKNGFKGIIRRWMLYKQSQMLIYDIGNNRWCGNIQRQHKSNHVYYVADLKLKILYQKCHDPECDNFRSADIVIPDRLNPFFLDEIEDCVEDFDLSTDEELNKLLNAEFEIHNIENTSHAKLQIDDISELSTEEINAFVSDEDINKTYFAQEKYSDCYNASPAKIKKISHDSEVDGLPFDEDTLFNIEKSVDIEEMINKSQTSFVGISVDNLNKKTVSNVDLHNCKYSKTKEVEFEEHFIDLSKDDDICYNSNESCMDLFSDNHEEETLSHSKTDNSFKNDSNRTLLGEISDIVPSEQNEKDCVKAIDSFILDELYSNGHNDSLFDVL